MNWSDPAKRGQDFTRLAGKHAQEVARQDGVKIGGDWFSDPTRNGPKSNVRKRASAMIAKIPPGLSRYIARVFKPSSQVAA